MDESRHIRVKGSHQLLGVFNDSNVHPQLTQIFRKLKTDKAATCQHHRLRVIFIYIILDPKRVFYGTKCKHLIKVCAGKSGLCRLYSGRKNEFIVDFLKFIAGFEIFHRHGLSVGMDRRNLVTNSHIHAESGEKALGRLEGQVLRVFNHISDIVWQSAVGVGDVSRTLKNHDLCLFIEPSDSCGGGCSACHTAYNHNFHNYRSTFPR